MHAIERTHTPWLLLFSRSLPRFDPNSAPPPTASTRFEGEKRGAIRRWIREGKAASSARSRTSEDYRNLDLFIHSANSSQRGNVMTQPNFQRERPIGAAIPLSSADPPPLGHAPITPHDPPEQPSASAASATAPTKSLLFLRSGLSAASVAKVDAPWCIADLEDSVPLHRKPAMRQWLVSLLEAGSFRDRGLMVRVNGLDRFEEAKLFFRVEKIISFDFKILRKS